MEHKVVMIKAPILKRVCAFVIDFFIFVSVAFILSSLFTPIMDMFPDVQKGKNDYISIALESGIYQGDTYDTLDYINENYDEAITAFYIKYDNIENYDNLKGTTYSEYFTFDINLGKYIEAKTEQEMAQVYLNIMSTECEEILSQNDNYQNAKAIVASYEVTNYLISFVLGGAIVYFVVPLILKNGRTFSKKLLQLQVVSINEDYHLRPVKLVCRSLILLFIEMILGILTFGILPLVSFISVIMSKKSLSLHDFIVGTVVIDSTLFPTEENQLKQVVVTSFASEEQDLFDGIK